MDDDPLEGGRASQVGPQVTDLNIEFFDGVLWSNGWDNDEKFPEAVYVRIVVVDRDGIEQSRVFATTVGIMAN